MRTGGSVHRETLLHFESKPHLLASETANKDFIIKNLEGSVLSQWLLDHIAQGVKLLNELNFCHSDNFRIRGLDHCRWLHTQPAGKAF